MIISADALLAVVAAVCRAGGSDADEVARVARHLVDANLMGHDSHGVGMIPAYVDSLRDGWLYPNRHVAVRVDGGAILQLDGQRGYGQVIGAEAMERGIAKAREHGVAVVALRNTHHLGRIGAWGEMCAGAGFVSIHYVNATVTRALVAPFGGSDARFTTDPYCTAIPATGSNPPIILDMATSRIAMGKVRVAHNKGVEVPDDALIDSTGRATRDPGVMFRSPRGALRSMGEHKGYGLALICESLAGAFTGGGVFRIENQSETGIINNMLSVIIDPDAVGERGALEHEVTALLGWVKASPPRAGFDEVLLPGEPERRRRAERLAGGIGIDEQSWREIRTAALAAGLSEADVDGLSD